MKESFELGNTDMDIFPLGFGGIPIQRVSHEKAVEVVSEAVSRGINFIDTARAYSDSEEKIGDALNAFKKDQDTDKSIYLATKTPAQNSEEALEDVEKSLEHLQVDKIDLYQLHNVSSEEDYHNQVKKDDSAFRGLKKAQRRGLIEHIGITGHSDDLLLEALQEYDFATVQFCYNFIESEAEEELIPYARDHHIGMIAMKPLAGGRLERADISLKYILNQDKVVPIPGMETGNEVRENIVAARNSDELTVKEEEYLQQRREELGNQFCRRCQYCLPCPEEIKIPVVLRVESFFNRMPVADLKEGPYETFLKAEDCTECMECVAKCPYDLPIPELLKENLEFARREIEGH